MDDPTSGVSSGSGAPLTPQPPIDKETLKKLTSGFKPGDVIADRYEVQKMLGRGGMGMVYLAWDREALRPVALKTLLPQYLASTHAVKRFVREINAVRTLDHPCIVKIYDARQVGAVMFYAMEYVEGTSLYTLMKRRGRLGLNSVVRVLSLLCHALEHAHQYAVHRDLSPDNVMVLADGNIKLLDFGLAKLTNTQAAFTMIGVSLGKQQYMAPEQRASAAEVDKRADIYSLGVMFFELLTGKLPKGDERITDLVPGLHEEANAFVRKAMAHRPEDRYADAREFRHALARVYKLSTGISIPGADGESAPPPTPVPISEQSSAPPSAPPPHAKSGWGVLLRGFLDGILGRLRIK